MARTAPRKQPIEVTVVGSFATGDFSGLAGVLLRLSKQSTLKVISNNEQQSSPISSQQQGSVGHLD